MVSGGLSFASTLGMDVGGRWNGVEYLESGQTAAITEMAMPETAAEGARARPLLGVPGFPCPIRYSHDPEIVRRGLQGGISKNVTAPYNLEIIEPGVRQFFG